MQRTLFEICVDSVAGVLAARDGGADRAELCSDLLEGGLTPSAGTMELACEQRGALAVFAMIRPRGGDFLYSDVEFEVMKRDIARARECGVDGVVFGILRRDGSIDRERTADLVSLARPLGVTFHRAFDVCRDPRAALETLIELGVDRVLTSGQEATVVEGLDLIGALVRQAAGRIIVMPGCGVREENIEQVVRGSGAREVHFSSRKAKDSEMEYRNPRCAMGAASGEAEFRLMVPDRERIGRLRRALGES